MTSGSQVFAKGLHRHHHMAAASGCHLTSWSTKFSAKSTASGATAVGRFVRCPAWRCAASQRVLNAIAWLELYGFIDKLRRIVRTTGLLGPRVRQTSNAYVLRFPKGLGRLAVNVFHLAPDHNDSGSIKVKQ